MEPKFRSVSVFAPATVANLACGFDVLGLAVEAPGDSVTVTLQERGGVIVSQITGDGGRLPRDAAKNTATVAINSFLSALKLNLSLSIEIEKQMPLGSGLGSSAASSAAAIVAVNELLGAPLTRKELVRFAMEGERIACGAAHADNVAPAIMGGIILIRSYDPLDIVELPVPSELFVSVIHPHIEVRTEDARKVLRREIALDKAVRQWGNIAGLISGLYQSDYALIGRSLLDEIIEPERSILIPGFDSAKKAAFAAGSLGFSISGSGPSVFAFSRGEVVAKDVSERIVKEFSTIGIQADSYTSKVNPQGAVVKERLS